MKPQYYVPVDWGFLFSKLMFPGFGFGGISKADLLSMTYPQFRSLLKSLDRIEKDKEEFQSEIPHNSLNEMIQDWRKEKDADNKHSDTSS